MNFSIIRLLFIFLSFVQTFGFPQQNHLLASLRSIVSGVTSNLNFDFLDGFAVPDSMVPQELKAIKYGICGFQQVPRLLTPKSSVKKKTITVGYQKV